ncbi:hypothetical protein D9M71_594610 [compost metagenome]
MQLGADATQPLETVAGHLAQTNAGIGEFYAAPVLDEQRQAQLVLELSNLPADRPMRHVQLFGRRAHAAQTGGSLEGAQGIEGREVAAHGIQSVSFPDRSQRSYRFSKTSHSRILAPYL